MSENDCLKISIYFRSEVHAVKGILGKQNIRKWGIIGLLLACILCSCINFFKNRQEKDGENSRWNNHVAVFVGRQMELAYFQIPAFLSEGEKNISTTGKLEKCVLREFPLYYYSGFIEAAYMEQEDSLLAELMTRNEGTDEDYKNIDEESLDYDDDALHIEGSMLEELEKENRVHNTGDDENQDGVGKINEEDSILAGPSGEFRRPDYPAYTYDWAEQQSNESLISNFFAVDSSTLLDEKYLDLDKLLYEDLSVDKTVDGPQILIYHTHSREAFEDSVEGDPSTTIVGAGERLAYLLQEEYGFKVLHHTGEYDAVRDDAYAEALPAIEQILAENPTIEVVIDLHRDATSNDRKLVMNLQGRPTARFMFFDGLSYLRKSGSIDYLENPYIQDNLAMSFQAQVAANEYYPGIARKVYLKAFRYNMHLKPKSMLIELGAQNNTVEEIMNACDPLAHIIAIVLDGMS